MSRFKEPLMGAIGISIKVSDLPALDRYQKLSRKLAKMGKFRRWISWRLRAKHEETRAQVEREVQAAVNRNMNKRGGPRGLLFR